MKNTVENKDKKALISDIFEANYEKVSKYCYLHIQNKHDIEDIVSETFLRAYDNIDKFEGSNYTGWLCRIARNLIFDKFKSLESRKVINTIQYEDYFEDPNYDVEKKAMIKDEYDQILSMFNFLTDSQKEAITLRYIQELEFDEIAEIMEKSENAVRVLISKGLDELKQYAK